MDDVYKIKHCRMPGGEKGIHDDIFISYAHIDNLPPLPGKEGWITNFHRAMELRVAQLLGTRPRVWRDPKLTGNDVFAETLVDKLRGVALLVSVLSPSYIHSEWCRKELHEFVEVNETGGGLTIGDKSRIFKVVKTPVPREKLPTEVQPLLGYEFYRIDPETGHAHELNEIFGEQAQVEFWMKLDDLAHDIVETLDLVSKPDAADLAQAPAENSALPVVYLAETTADMRDARDSLKRELQRAGYTVLPDEPFPLSSPEFEQFVERQLTRCRLSIHPVGSRYGLVPEGAQQSIIELQSALAAKREATGLERLVWIAPGTSAVDERQVQTLADLRSGKGLTLQSDLYEVSLEDFKSAIRQRLEELAQPRPQACSSSAKVGAAARVYLICDQPDGLAAAPISDALFDKGFDVTLPVFEGNETELREDHEENLRICDAVLIYHGAGTEIWLRSKLRDLTRIAGLGRTEPFQGVGVYIAGTPTPQKETFRTHDALVMKNFGQFDFLTLAPFVALLEAPNNVPEGN